MLFFVNDPIINLRLCSTTAHGNSFALNLIPLQTDMLFWASVVLFYRGSQDRDDLYKYHTGAVAIPSNVAALFS